MEVLLRTTPCLPPVLYCLTIDISSIKKIIVSFFIKDLQDKDVILTDISDTLLYVILASICVRGLGFIILTVGNKVSLKFYSVA